MSSDVKVVPIWSEYNKSMIWKYIPTVGSSVVVAILIVCNLILLENEALLVDSILPILESHRFDNLLIGMTIASGLGILVYFILAYLTKAYFLSVTETSELNDLLERAKTKMRIDIDTQLRIHDEDGLNIVTERNVVFSSIVMSREAQTAILEQQDMGEVVLAGELSSLECSRPWVRIAALATFFGTAWIYLFPLQYKLALVDIYGMMPLVTELLLPFFLFFMGTGLFKLSKSSFRISYVKTIKEYPILPSLAKQIVFEKLTFTEEAIKKRIQFFNRHIAFTSDYWGKLCAIIFIGGISVILIFGTIINMFNEYGLQVPFELTLWLLAAMFAIVLAFALPAFKYDL